MKFKTRLMIAFLMITILPIILTILVYIGIGTGSAYRARKQFGFDDMKFSVLADPVETNTAIADEYFGILCDMVKDGDRKIEDVNFLRETNEELKRVSSFLIIQKNDTLYYSGAPLSAQLLYDSLPEYGTNPSGSGFYLSDQQKLIKQLDFIFEDGALGSIFLVTSINLMLSESLAGNMLWAVLLILLVTSLLLVSWIQHSVFQPVGDLNIAMNHIAEGDLEYSLNTDQKGEMGKLYKNFEIMRQQIKKSANRQLEAEKNNRELVSNISHDLKTPITSIKGYVEGIVDGVADTPEKMARYIRTIYNKTNDMDHLVDELTIYSKIDANEIPYHFRKLNICDYFDDCIDELRLDLTEKGIAVTFENHFGEGTWSDGKLVSPGQNNETTESKQCVAAENQYSVTDNRILVMADPEQLKRVINNIISNSVKYRDKEEGKICIRLFDERENVRVEIEDNGRGISEVDKEKIFTRFYRTDTSRNSSKGGSGIGLSIAKKIIEDHGGMVGASGHEKEGLCIYFTLRKCSESIPKEVHEEESWTDNMLEKLHLQTLVKSVEKNVERFTKGSNQEEGQNGGKTGGQEKNSDNRG